MIGLKELAMRGDESIPAHSLPGLPAHISVMPAEVMAALDLKPGQVAVDGTLGLGGHAAKMLDAVSPGGTLVASDWDEGMLAIAAERLGAADFQSRLVLRHADFRALGELLDELGLKVDGALLDLGLNSAQIEDPTRGMAFKHEGPLDLRMDRTRGEPAAALLNRLSPQEIEQILFDYADERWARAIARRIVERRKANPLRTTSDLVDAVLAAIPAGARDRRIHPATRTFQALRIYVNSELDGLDDALSALADRLAPNGTLAVLSYHSGRGPYRQEYVPQVSHGWLPGAISQAANAHEEEVKRNPRSRSAKLRALRRPSTDMQGGNNERQHL